MNKGFELTRGNFTTSFKNLSKNKIKIGLFESTTFYSFNHRSKLLYWVKIRSTRWQIYAPIPFVEKRGFIILMILKMFVILIIISEYPNRLKVVISYFCKKKIEVTKNK